MMRKRFGQIGGWALAVALMIPAAVSAQSPLVDRTDSFVPFAAPDSTLNATAVNHVQLASCCTSDGCATSPCQAPGCDSACCDSGCCEPGCGAASCCAAGCCGCADGDLLDSLLGLLHPSESCYDYFLSPMTNPVFFEDPRTLTEARFIYLHHKVPLTAAGGDVNLVAMQLRAALTDRLSLIATKDGFITSTNPLIDDGWSDINVGLKYNLIRRPDLQFLYSVGATYEMPVGSTRAVDPNVWTTQGVE